LTDIDKEKLLEWMREIQTHYDKVWHDESLEEIIRHDASVSWGLCLAMGLEIKEGRFDKTCSEFPIDTSMSHD